RSVDRGLLGSSPRLIAACNVLHRLPAPRHPPSALQYLPRRCSRSLCTSQGTRLATCWRLRGLVARPFACGGQPEVRRVRSLQSCTVCPTTLPQPPSVRS